MAAAAPIAAIASIAGTAYGLYSSMQAARAQDDAAEEAARIGRENEARIEAETREEARRLSAQQRATEGRARAVAAASGAAPGTGSMGLAIEGMSAEHKRQLDWLNTAGASQASIARREGAYQAASARAGASSTRAGAISGAVGGISQVGGLAKRAGWSWGF